MAASSPDSQRGWSRIFSGPNLLQVAMPLGGIGAGCVCLNGYGGLQDFSIRNQPATTAMPDGHGFTDSAFALLHIKGERPMTRLVEGPMPPEKVYDQGIQGQGYRKGGHEGLPRFENCTFEGAYPFGTVQLSDPNVPVKATVEGWSPFIPLDDKNSGIPCAILNYTLQNVSNAPVDCELSYHWSHPVQGSKGETGTRNAALPGHGVYFHNSEEPADATFGSAALVVARHTPAVKAMWFRGGWFDSLSALWREVYSGAFVENDGSVSQRGVGGRNGGSVLVRGTLQPGETVTIPFILTWHFPNCHQSVGVVAGDEFSRVWHPYYTTQWKDAQEVAQYVLDNLDALYQRTAAFRDALFASTLPPSVLDAASANLAILKSPTVLRQANGNLWGWEGCFATGGCCHGTCTHVWNYAQAFPHLFPALERTLREQEYLRSMDGRGHVNFRAALPDAPTVHDFHAAADGQLGGLLKLHRDWQISGDTAWLERLYPLAKRSLDFCIAAWDPEERGALFEPHHNTYDIEFWGPDGMCSSVYIGALSALGQIAQALGKDADAAHYEEIARKGAAFLDAELFNGAYYEQKVQWDGLRDTSFATQIARMPDDADEMALLLKREGPKYQYGTGCLSDGVIGAWMAAIYGVETPLSRENIRNHLKAIFDHNFKPDLSEHACLQRPGYAIGHEPGLLLCSWPRGGKPTLPFVYSDEVWTGIEYQVASHLIAEGLVDEGLTIVEAVRRRYDGHVRNPYNEYECGNYYARALSSYALLGALSGFRYSAVTRTLWFGPKLPVDGFTTFFSTATGFGTIRQDASALTVTMVEGELAVDTLNIISDGATVTVPSGVVARAGEPAHIELPASATS
jgi:uncharacterized protein (DUF608 family)